MPEDFAQPAASKVRLRFVCWKRVGNKLEPVGVGGAVDIRTAINDTFGHVSIGNITHSLASAWDRIDNSEVTIDLENSGYKHGSWLGAANYFKYINDKKYLYECQILVEKTLVEIENATDKATVYITESEWTRRSAPLTSVHNDALLPDRVAQGTEYQIVYGGYIARETWKVSESGMIASFSIRSYTEWMKEWHYKPIFAYSRFAKNFNQVINYPLNTVGANMHPLPTADPPVAPTPEYIDGGCDFVDGLFDNVISYVDVTSLEITSIWGLRKLRRVGTEATDTVDALFPYDLGSVNQKMFIEINGSASLGDAKFGWGDVIPYTTVYKNAGRPIQPMSWGYKDFKAAHLGGGWTIRWGHPECCLPFEPVGVEAYLSPYMGTILNAMSKFECYTGEIDVIGIFIGRGDNRQAKWFLAKWYNYKYYMASEAPFYPEEADDYIYLHLLWDGHSAPTSNKGVTLAYKNADAAGAFYSIFDDGYYLSKTNLAERTGISEVVVVQSAMKTLQTIPPSATDAMVYYVIRQYQENSETYWRTEKTVFAIGFTGYGDGVRLNPNFTPVAKKFSPPDGWQEQPFRAVLTKYKGAYCWCMVINKERDSYLQIMSLEGKILEDILIVPKATGAVHICPVYTEDDGAELASWDIHFAGGSDGGVITGVIGNLRDMESVNLETSYIPEIEDNKDYFELLTELCRSFGYVWWVRPMGYYDGDVPKKVLVVRPKSKYHDYERTDLIKVAKPCGMWKGGYWQEAVDRVKMDLGGETSIEIGTGNGFDTSLPYQFYMDYARRLCCAYLDFFSLRREAEIDFRLYYTNLLNSISYGNIWTVWRETLQISATEMQTSLVLLDELKTGILSPSLPCLFGGLYWNPNGGEGDKWGYHNEDRIGGFSASSCGVCESCVMLLGVLTDKWVDLANASGISSTYVGTYPRGYWDTSAIYEYLLGVCYDQWQTEFNDVIDCLHDSCGLIVGGS